MRLLFLGAALATVLATSATSATASRITVEPGGIVTATGRLKVESPLGLIRVTCQKTETINFNTTPEGSLVLNGNNGGTITGIRLRECEGGGIDASLSRSVSFSHVRITRTEWELAALSFQLLITTEGFRCLLTVLMTIKSTGRGAFEYWELSLGRVLRVDTLAGSLSCPSEWILEGPFLPLSRTMRIGLTA
jgi:hypothetical protein